MLSDRKTHTGDIMRVCLSSTNTDPIFTTKYELQENKILNTEWLHVSLKIRPVKAPWIIKTYSRVVYSSCKFCENKEHLQSVFFKVIFGDS